MYEYICCEAPFERQMAQGNDPPLFRNAQRARSEDVSHEGREFDIYDENGPETFDSVGNQLESSIQNNLESLIQTCLRVDDGERPNTDCLLNQLMDLSRRHSAHFDPGTSAGNPNHIYSDADPLDIDPVWVTR